MPSGKPTFHHTAIALLDGIGTEAVMFWRGFHTAESDDGFEFEIRPLWQSEMENFV
jgi:hypothetical protein